MAYFLTLQNTNPFFFPIPRSFFASARPVASNLSYSSKYFLLIYCRVLASHLLRQQQHNNTNNQEKMRSSTIIPLAAAVLPAVMARPNGGVFQRGWGGGGPGGGDFGGFGGGHQSAGAGYGGSSGPSTAGKNTLTSPFLFG